MKFILFYHSLRSDWNHGNAHFLRGVVTDLLARGHDVKVYEPADAWSVQNLRAEHGDGPIEAFYAAYPTLRDANVIYDPKTLDPHEATAEADVVIVHEWNAHDMVRRIGEVRANGGKFQLLFHDTHHRAVTEEAAMAAYDLRHYDGVLAFGAVLRDLYLSRGWTRQAWVWHEAADVRVFHPLPNTPKDLDLIWVGNWGDEERTTELQEFLLDPVAALKLNARVHGVRYPATAMASLDYAGIAYGGWLPNFAAPAALAAARVTVHIPRRPYTLFLPGIPTIRPFEALACGIPLICSPWNDAENLFTPGEDFLVARDGVEMQEHLRAVLHEPQLAASLASHGRQTILARHTCTHRVDQLLNILDGSDA